jgi:hypothetical protein
MQEIMVFLARGVAACSANCARDRSYPDALEVIQIEHQSRAMRDREVLHNPCNQPFIPPFAVPLRSTAAGSGVESCCDAEATCNNN